MTLPTQQNTNEPRAVRERSGRLQRRTRERAMPSLPQPQPQPQNSLLQRFSDETFTTINFNKNDETESKTLPPGSTDFATQMRVMTEYMVSKVQNVKGTKEFTTLKQMADKAKSIYNSFIISGNSTDFLDLQEPFKKLSALSLSFNNKYMQALEAKQTNAREKTVTNLIADSFKKDLENAIEKVDSVIKIMSEKIEDSSAHYSALKNLLNNTLIFKKKLIEFKPLKNENLNRINKRIAALSKSSEKNLTQFNYLIREKEPILVNSKNLVVGHRYLTIIQENLKNLEKILLKLEERQGDIMSLQQTWLVTQVNIMNLSGKESADIKNRIPGTNEMSHLNKRIAASLKNLADFVEVKMDAKQNISSKIIMTQCQKYFSEHHDNLEKLKSFSEILTKTFSPLHIHFEEIQTLHKTISDLASQALIIQRALEQNNREPSRKKRRRHKNLRNTGVASTTHVKLPETSSSPAPLENKKNPTGIQSLPLQQVTAFASSIPGVETPKTNLISSSSSSSLFADSFGFSSSSTLPERPVQITLDDFVVKKMVERQIKAVLEDPAVIDFEIEEKISLVSMQEMLIKQNALLMIFCRFSESLLQGNFSLRPHLENHHFINQARDCIYHHFSRVFSCVWPSRPEDLADAQLRIAMYKRVVALLNALHESITSVDYRKLSENELFKELITSYNSRTMDCAEADAKPAFRYFNTINTAPLSLTLSSETQELAGKFALGAKDAAAKVLKRKQKNHSTDRLFRHETLSFPSPTRSSH